MKVSKDPIRDEQRLELRLFGARLQHCYNGSAQRTDQTRVAAQAHDTHTRHLPAVAHLLARMPVVHVFLVHVRLCVVSCCSLHAWKLAAYRRNHRVESDTDGAITYNIKTQAFGVYLPFRGLRKCNRMMKLFSAIAAWEGRIRRHHHALLRRHVVLFSKFPLTLHSGRVHPASATTRGRTQAIYEETGREAKRVGILARFDG